MSKAKEILNKISEGVPSWEPKLKKAVVNIRTVMKKYSEYGAGDTEAEEFAFYWLPKYAYEGKSWKEYGEEWQLYDYNSSAINALNKASKVFYKLLLQLAEDEVPLESVKNRFYN